VNRHRGAARKRDHPPRRPADRHHQHAKVIERRDGEGVPVSEAFQLKADARETALNGQVARTLQVYPDGHRGTGLGIDAYRRVIETFED